MSRGGLTNQQYSGEWGDRGQGNEIQSAIENGLTWAYKTFINPDKDPNIIGGTAMVPGLGKAKNAAEALKMVQAMKAQKAAKAAQAVKPTLPKSINESGLTRSGKNNLNGIINALPEAERQSVTEALLNHQKFWNEYGDGMINVSPNRAASIINAIRRKLGFSGQGNTYQGAVKYGTQRSGFKEGLTEDATSLTTGIGRTTKLKPE